MPTPIPSTNRFQQGTGEPTRWPGRAQPRSIVATDSFLAKLVALLLVRACLDTPWGGAIGPGLGAEHFLASALARARTAAFNRGGSAQDAESALVSTGTVPYGELIEAAAAKYGLSPALIAAVIKAESNFNQNAVSSAGAKGLMQLMDGTALQLGVADVFDPKENIEGGARFLRSLINRYGGDLPRALAAYNAGPGAVDSYGGIPPYQETQTYVARVLNYSDQFGTRLA